MKNRPFIGAIGKKFFEKREQSKERREQQDAAVAILNARGCDDAMQKQSLHIDQNMPFLALDQLARVKAMRVNLRPPFSALFTL